MRRIFVHTKRAGTRTHEQWFGVEPYIQNVDPVGENKCIFKNRSTCIL